MTTNTTSPAPRGGRDVASLAVFLVLCVTLLRLGYLPPAPLPEGAPDTEFSASRARAIAEDLLDAAGGGAHLTGTPENRAVRAELVARLERLGLELVPRHPRPIQGGSPSSPAPAVSPGGASWRTIVFDERMSVVPSALSHAP